MFFGDFVQRNDSDYDVFLSSIVNTTIFVQYQYTHFKTQAVCYFSFFIYLFIILIFVLKSDFLVYLRLGKWMISCAYNPR